MLLSRRYTFSVLREKCSQLRIIYPARVPFKKNKRKQNIDLSDKQKPNKLYHKKTHVLKGILKQPITTEFHNSYRNLILNLIENILRA